jgi:D-alanyl-D-alanine carboxypeptidase/D-alanyl-D-alanine-endopeptidase (penicillin-binding protein 4)
LRGPLAGSREPDQVLQQVFRSPTHAYECPAKNVAAPALPGVTLATHLSPAVAEDVVLTAKVSQNLHAEIMLRNLGVAYTCGRTERDALHVVREYLRFAGIDPADLVLYDGSGLSGHDLVAPRAFTQLLVFAAKQTWFDAFKAALPIGGVDGTLASRFTPPNSKLQGKVFAKTGTLGESRDLAGYVTAASGRTIVFSIMADTHRPDTSADRVAMDKIVEAIAAAN